jgi:hypothetical protein
MLVPNAGLKLDDEQERGPLIFVTPVEKAQFAPSGNKTRVTFSPLFSNLRARNAALVLALRFENGGKKTLVYALVTKLLLKIVQLYNTIQYNTNY